MSAQLIRLRDAGADTLIFYTVDRETDAILRSMDRIGYKPTIVSAWGIGVQLGKTAGALTEGVLVHGTFAWTGQLSPRAQKVWERIKAKEKLKDPSELVLPSGTANAYDAVVHHRRGAQDRRRLRQEEAARCLLPGEVRGHHRQLQTRPSRRRRSATTRSCRPSTSCSPITRAS